MRHISLLIILTIIPYTFSLASEIVEVQLPDLLGSYTIDVYRRSCVFQLERAPLKVYKVWIHCSGSMNLGEHYCSIFPGLPTGPYPTPMEFHASIRDTVSGNLWRAFYISEDLGLFEFTIQFDDFHFAPATWDFLLSGYGTVEHIAGPIGLITMCWYDVFPDATLEESVLVIEGDFPADAEYSTWGSIKALFR